MQKLIKKQETLDEWTQLCIKFMFLKKAAKNYKIFAVDVVDVYLVGVKSTVKIL